MKRGAMKPRPAAGDGGAAARLRIGVRDRVQRRRARVSLALLVLAGPLLAEPVAADAQQTLHLQLKGVTTASSNAALAARAVESGALDVSVVAPYTLVTPRRAISVLTQASARRYSTRALSQSHDAGISGTWRERLHRSTWRIEAGGDSRTLTDRLEAGSGVFDTRRRRASLHVGGGVEHALTASQQLLLSVSAVQARYLGDGTGAAADDALIDYGADRVQAGWRTATSPTLTLGLAIETAGFRPRASLPRSRTWSLASSGEWQPTASWQVSWRAGIEKSLRSDPASRSVDGAAADWAPVADFGVHREGERQTLSLTIARALQPSAAGTLTRNTSVAVEARHRQSPTRELYAVAHWAHIDTTTPATPASRRPDIDGETRTLGAGLRWQAVRNWQFDLSYRHARNDRGRAANGDADAGADDHSIQFAATYGATALRW